MSLDTSKKIKSVTYNGTEIPLDDAGSNALLNELRTQLLAVQGELQTKEAELEAKEAELIAKEAELTAQQAIEDSLVDTRTLTTYYNNRVSEVYLYAFTSRTSLESVHFPNVTGQLRYASFMSCSALKEAIFEKVPIISGEVFRKCSALTVLVLGASKVCTLANANSFSDSSIASGTGFVYVRDNLVESYKTATNWSTYAAQIKPISELQTTHPEIYAKLEL